MAATYITKFNERLDKICYAYYGTTASRQVEIVLDNNPGLENEGILLTAGITITLPDIEEVAVPVAKTIKLWQ